MCHGEMSCSVFKGNTKSALWISSRLSLNITVAKMIFPRVHTSVSLLHRAASFDWEKACIRRFFSIGSEDITNQYHSVRESFFTGFTIVLSIHILRASHKLNQLTFVAVVGHDSTVLTLTYIKDEVVVIDEPAKQTNTPPEAPPTSPVMHVKHAPFIHWLR